MWLCRTCPPTMPLFPLLYSQQIGKGKKSIVTADGDNREWRTQKPIKTRTRAGTGPARTLISSAARQSSWSITNCFFFLFLFFFIFCFSSLRSPGGRAGEEVQRKDDERNLGTVQQELCSQPEEQSRRRRGGCPGCCPGCVGVSTCLTFLFYLFVLLSSWQPRRCPLKELWFSQVLMFFLVSGEGLTSLLALLLCWTITEKLRTALHHVRIAHSNSSQNMFMNEWWLWSVLIIDYRCEVGE